MEQLFKAIQAIAEANPDGFTVDLTTLKKVTKGISVAYLETQDSFGEEGLKRVLNHALMHEKKVGGWFNEENGMFTNLEEAKQFGRENGQIAIFDIGQMRLIKL